MSRISRVGGDLVQDLRDRRLLIPAIVLIVAIIAVPVLLGAGGGSDDAGVVTAPVTQAPAAMDGAEQVAPVVLADVPGLREYRKRLGGKNGRNPFIQQTVPGTSGSGGNGGGGGNGGSSSGAGSSGSGTSSTGTSTGTSSSAASTPPATDTSTGGTSGSGATGGGSSPEFRLVKFTIDVRVGKAGATKVLKDVEPLELLPGGNNPIVQYVNSSRDAKRAAFVVSPRVLGSDGDGKCKPGRNNCQFLFMEPGDVHRFSYGDQHQTYRLELLGIHRTLVPLRDGGDSAAG